MVDLVAQLEAETSAQEQPEHEDHREVHAAERGRVRGGEREEQDTAGGDQPYLVAAPYRADRLEDLIALLLVRRDPPVQRAGTEVEAVEHDVDRDHQAQEDEPRGDHRAAHSSPRAGPRARMRATSST
jgi:hypothetical protein